MCVYIYCIYIFKVWLFMSHKPIPNTSSKNHPIAENHPRMVGLMAGRQGRYRCIISLKEPGRGERDRAGPCQVEVLLGACWLRIELIYIYICIYIYIHINFHDMYHVSLYFSHIVYIYGFPLPSLCFRSFSLTIT